MRGYQEKGCSTIYDSYTILHIDWYIQIYIDSGIYSTMSMPINEYILIGIEISICMNMPSKIKESTKEYKRDRNNRMTNQWTWKHYTVSGTSTEELQKYYKSLPRKRNIIRRELLKRGCQVEVN